MNDDIDSVFPPTKYLTFGPWIYMVPQYKPKSVLILGYAGGTVAGLIRLLYGDVPITAVDIRPCEDIYGVTFIQQDANEFVKTCGSFDATIVDMFPINGWEICDFITSKEFVQNLKRISRYVVVNTLKEPDMSEYYCMQLVGRNKASGLSNIVYYFKNGEIPDLLPLK